ncbi:polysaccharide deacetylase family protein [Nitratireductor pacificus]|uniref:Chitooligosaccharide deacetylase n=1 Tax=Nitratireductor pacificus pht-3B TaxID=391937 RepID=K2M9D4_9HYPH|nr:polysaccharide deacetylase family protein [Nitratireductor pacificus]EKF17620.1 chitooligosaccharide deacetylase [Nitratireductor pacificus pht-3B]
MSRRLLISSVSLALVLAIVFGLYKLSSSRTYQAFGDLVARVETGRPVIALTFDDGPTARFTNEVLGILDDLDVKATFFVTGREVTENPAETRAIVAAGHELGNHSYSHPRMVMKSYATYRSEIEKTDAAIRTIGYEKPLHFRPPYGKKLFGLPWYLSSTGRTTVTWDVEPETYPEVADDLDAFVAHVVDRARSGSIVLMHVMYESRATSREALPLVVAGLRERGFTFVTVSELLEERK